MKRLVAFLATVLHLACSGSAPGQTPFDISEETERHVIVAAGTKTDYRGQVNTVLMKDGKTMFAVWSIGHGGKCGPLKKSSDGGRTWSKMLPTPDNWRSVGSCPCIFRLADPEGTQRLFVFAGRGKLHQSMSLDGGRTWTPMTVNGLYKPGGNTVIVPIEGGRRHLLLAQRGPVSKPTNEKTQSVWQATSSDGGQTWADYRKVCEVSGAVPCEPELVRSPDGKQLLCLMRENSRRLNSLMMVSSDEGKSWSKAKELTASLTGDRHMSCYAPDGRLIVCFRDRAKGSPTAGHYVAWIGRYEDVIHGREGQYRVKLLHHHGDRFGDCGYSGLECLPEGTLVATTYVKYRPGPEKNSIVSVRFKLTEIDARANDAGGGTPANADSPGKAAARPAIAEAAISENVFEFEGKRIAYVEAGAGDAVYLAHGAACDYTDWRKQLGPLSEGFHVIAADEPFFGKSDPGPLPRDLRWSAAAIWALLDHLQVERVVLVGHSGGAGLCHEMYFARQARVRGFVSVDSGTGGKISSKERDKRGLVLPPAHRARAEKNREALADMGRVTDFPSDLNIAILRKHQAARQRYLKLVKGQRAPLATKSDTSKWCKVPLLLFTSGRGRMGQEDLSLGWIEEHAAGRDARVVVVRETGHWIMLEQPEVFNRELIRFLRSLP